MPFFGDIITAPVNAMPLAEVGLGEKWQERSAEGHLESSQHGLVRTGLDTDST